MADEIDLEAQSGRRAYWRERAEEAEARNVATMREALNAAERDLERAVSELDAEREHADALAEAAANVLGYHTTPSGSSLIALRDALAVHGARREARR